MTKKDEKESYSSLKENSSINNKSFSVKSSQDKQNKEEEESSSLQPLPLILNKVQKRVLFLSPTVTTGLERECNKNDFYRQGDSYIGKGAFGEVWKVSHKMTGKIYVIKVMNKSDFKEQKLMEQINREIEIMYKLNHPHVMRLINHFEDDEKFYLIMPYASKGQLYSLLRRQVRFDQRTAAQYMREVLEAVRYIHSFSPKIIHRDIKPENLLLDDNYRVLLSDFGWSNFLDENEYRKTFCGTPEYLSPEMAKKEGHNEMVDIWALGVLLFEFLAGYAPFTGSCPKELYSNIKKLKINWPIDFPPLAKNLVTKILKLNPAERLSLEEILDHPWFTQNPPLRHVLTNYLTNEKDIYKSHLIIEKPENVEDKLNYITDPHKKRKFGTLRMKLTEEEESSDNDDDITSNENNVNSSCNNSKNIDNDKDNSNKNKNNNNKIMGINNIYMGNINENFIFIKKQKKILQKKYDELVIKEEKENQLIKKYQEENEKLKNKQKNLQNSNIVLIDQEIKKYKLLSEDREKLLKEIDELNLKNNELNLQNELLKNKNNLLQKQMKQLEDKINDLTKDNKNYELEKNELSNKIKNNETNYFNFDDNNNVDNFVDKLNEITEKNLKELKDNISPLNLDLNNFENKIDDLINNKVLTFLNDKMKNIDDLIKEENIPKIDDNSSFLEKNEKLIEELKEEKSKNIMNKDFKEFEELKNKNSILQERIQTLLEEKKINNQLMEEKNKELEKANIKVKNMKDKIFDINEYIKTKCNNKIFINKITTICNLDNIK